MKRARTTRLQEAQDPQTEPGRLAILARSASAEIGARIAQNPNTPFEALSLLAQKHPRQVLQNPSLALFLLENPQAPLRFSLPGLHAVLWCEEVPGSILRIAVESSDERAQNIIATCPKTSSDILRSLSCARSAYTRELVARHPNTDHQTLLRLCTDTARGARAAALRRCPSFAAQIAPLLALLEPGEARPFTEHLWIREERFQQRALLDALFHSDGELALLWVSMSPAAPEEYLREILSRAHKVSALLPGLLSNPALSAALLDEALVAFPQAANSSALAFQENLPLSLRGRVLDDLWELGDVQSLASKPIAGWVIEALFSTGEEAALIGLAKNVALPHPYFAPLFASSNSYVVFALAENPSAPPEIIKKIVTEWAPQTEPQSSFDFTFENTRSMLQRLIAKNPAAPPELLSLFSSSADVMVRRSLTQNPRLPAPLLASLAADPSEAVREGCAMRPSLPASLLRLLARDPEDKVRQKIALREDLPAAIAYELYEEGALRPHLARNPQTPAALLEKLIEAYPSFVARNPNTPPALLSRLAHSASEEVLDRVARHPNTPAETLKRLSVTKFREVALLNPSLETSWLYQQKFVHNTDDIPF